MARGIESPNSSDMALIGPTEHELHTKSLPKRTGPNFGYGKTGGAGNEERDMGRGQACSTDGPGRS